jgi:hypothetical protein
MHGDGSQIELVRAHDAGPRPSITLGRNVTRTPVHFLMIKMAKAYHFRLATHNCAVALECTRVEACCKRGRHGIGHRAK